MPTTAILFFINPHSGSVRRPWRSLITEFFSARSVDVHFVQLEKDTTSNQIKEQILSIQPNLVVAVGGDGTIKLVATALVIGTIPLGIIPAGSANGLAYELGIPSDPIQAMQILLTGKPITIHAITIQNEICLHLADIGLNAWAMKKFNRGNVRGWWGYGWASLQSLYYSRMHQINLQMDGQSMQLQAAMIVLANGTAYRTGAIINPAGSLLDHHFEVVVMKKISLLETLKMLFTHQPFNPDKLVVYKAQQVHIRCKKRIPFQMDGEYRGKVKNIDAKIVTNAISIITP
ncbi:MAG: diacylglycerol kinase family protein [Bacteroidetes bacterium]|nr:diacylglycerol kinase family protein [Bacteroidota bacterium]